MVRVRQYAIFISSVILWCSFSVFLMPYGCRVSPSPEIIATANTDDLPEIWESRTTIEGRKAIIDEMVRRNAVNELVTCLYKAKVSFGQSSFSKKNVINIVDALGRLKNPKVIEDLLIVTYLKDDDITISVLKAFKAMNYPDAALSTAEYLSSSNRNVRWQALDTLGALKNPQSVKDIYPLLSDSDSDIRWKAIHALGSIGSPSAINRISILLSDEDPSVQSAARTVLENMNVSAEDIQKMANIAEDIANRRLNISNVHQADIELQKAMAEIAVLKTRMHDKKDLNRLQRAKKETRLPPVLVMISPSDGYQTESTQVRIIGEAVSRVGLKKVDLFVNGKRIEDESVRGIKTVEALPPERIRFNRNVLLQTGINRIEIKAVNTDGITSETALTVKQVPRQRTVWAVVVGINTYSRLSNLKYATFDAKAIYNWLTTTNRIPPKNITLMLNEQATLMNLRSILGTNIKRVAGKDDTVLIFFAGHGAVERDAYSPDGDGLEKYILTYDTDPKDLYATAMPMREIAYIFNRIQSERLIFIVDACYSGASGGRTIGIANLRANLSESYLDRLSSGKGKIIITASGANEVSAEKDNLGHGVFTYYLLEGLRGKADVDRDGLITVDEAYRYVSETVPQETGQEQHPVKKGTVEGRLVLGISN